jgi:precorrin-3B synthase
MPAKALPEPKPGLHAEGAMVALAFGQMRGETLAAIAALGHELRPTPWRMLFLVGATTLPSIPGLIADDADPILRVTACTGAPACPQGLGETRSLARALALHLGPDQRLHISGCAKGCAHPGPAPIVLTATGQGYDLILNGTASATPSLRHLSPRTIQDHLKALHAPSL